MAKYNIVEKKGVNAAYRSLVPSHTKDVLQEGILRIIVMEKKYLDPDYSAKKLAEDLGTNTRYVSAVVNTRFHCNYTEFVNKYRIDEAMTILSDYHYEKVNMEEIASMVGFSNRQSFYSAFFRFKGMTPREYKMSHMQHRAKPSKGKNKQEN